MSENKNDIDELIVRVLAGEATPLEQTRLDSWRKNDAENESYFVAFEKTWSYANGHFAKQQLATVDVHAEWDEFVDRVDAKGASVKLNSPKVPLKIWLRIAAGLVLILVARWVINFYSAKGDLLFESKQESIALSLPDGSSVTLNRNSSLSYSKNFGEGTREVKLTGEAFFDVRPDAARPFLISVGDAIVEVVGTSFNIKSDPSKNVEVVVSTGVVKLKVPDANKEISLKEGDRGFFSTEKKELTSEVNSNINFLSWKTQRLVFVESDLSTVVEKLNEFYSAHISLPAEVPPTCVVTVTFDHQSLEAVLNVLENTLGLTIERKAGKIKIVKTGC